MEAAWAGGVNGREVMDRLFVQVASLLSDVGVFYVVVVKDNQLGASVCCCMYTPDEVTSSISVSGLSDCGIQLFTHCSLMCTCITAAIILNSSYSTLFSTLQMCSSSFSLSLLHVLLMKSTDDMTCVLVC